jgi:hypothetical protein
MGDAMELKDLEKMTVTKLREEVGKFEEIKGVSGMRKDQLIDIMCEKLDIHRPEKQIVGIDKSVLKKRMRALKVKKAEAEAEHDHEALADIRKRIKTYKRSIRKHTVMRAS